MITTKLENIVNCAMSLEGKPSILDKLASLDIPVKTSYRISKILNKCQTELKPYNTTREALIKKYGEEKSEGRLEVTKENMEVFIKEHSDLMSSDVNIDMDLIKIDDLGDVKTTPGLLLNLHWMLTE